MSSTLHHDAIVLVHRPHASWQVDGCQAPLFVCAEMFLGLRDIEVRRWHMWALHGELVAAGRTVATLSDFLVVEDIAWLEEQGARVAHKWYVDRDGVDPTIYRDISLGRCIEYDAKARAIRLLKLSKCIQRLRQRHPETPVFTDFEPQSIESRMLESLKIPAQRFGTSLAAHDGRPSAPVVASSLSTRIIAMGRHGGLIAMRWLARLCVRNQLASTPRVVVRIGMQSTMMLQSWLAERRPGIHFSLWMDYLMRPRTMLSLVLAGHSVTATSTSVAAESLSALARIGQATARMFTDEQRHAASGPHLQPLLDEMLGQLSSTLFPTAIAAIDDAYAELGRPGSALLVVPNDCQLLMRAWTLVAGRLGQASLVLQHGHLDYTEDGDHFTATHSAFWSDMVAQDYLAAGLQPGQLLVTGSPNADEYVHRQRAPRRQEASRATRPQVLIITTGNPGVQAYIGETWVCNYVTGILDALAPRYPDLSIALKLHPGENAELYRHHLGSRLPPGTEISDRGDLAQMIAQADLVISPPSTVVLEARVGGTPVILMPVPSVEGRQTTLAKVDGVVTVHSCADLTVAIDAILAGEPHPQTGTHPLDQFLGPLDARSSSRLLDAVDMLARAPRANRQSFLHICASESNAVH